MKMLIPILGLAGMVVPVRASMTYYNGTSGNTQYNSAVTLAGLTPSALESFGAGYGSLTAGNSEYSDTATGVNFFSFQSNGTTASTFSTTLPPLRTTNTTDLFEIVLPANVYAFSVNLVFTSAALADACFEASATFSSTCSGNQEAVWGTGSEFFGVVGDTPFSAVWIGKSINSSQNPFIEVSTFADATGAATPEVRSMLMMGTGLVSLGLLMRRMRKGAGSSSRC